MMVNAPMPFMPAILPSLPAITGAAPVAVGGVDFGQMLQSAAPLSEPVIELRHISPSSATKGVTDKNCNLVAAMQAPEAKLAINADISGATLPVKSEAAPTSAEAGNQSIEASPPSNAELPSQPVLNGSSVVPVSASNVAVQIQVASATAAPVLAQVAMIAATPAVAPPTMRSTAPNLTGRMEAAPARIAHTAFPLPPPTSDLIERVKPKIADPLAPTTTPATDRPSVTAPNIIGTMALPSSDADRAHQVPLGPPVAVDPGLGIANRQLDLSLGEQWLDQLAADIVAARSEESAFSFKLLPPRLGELDIRMQRGAEGLTLAFETGNDESAQIISAAQPRLVEELRAQGLRVADAQVNGGASQGGRHDTRNGQPQQQAHLAETRQHTAPTAPPKARQDGRYA